MHRNTPLRKDGVNEHDKRDDLGLHSHKIKDSKNDMLGNKMQNLPLLAGSHYTHSHGLLRKWQKSWDRKQTLMKKLVKSE